MSLPLFYPGWEKLSNYELGVHLLSHFITIQAADLGIKAGHLPKGFVEQVTQSLLNKKAEEYKNLPLELALHEAASKNFERAGKILRDHHKNTKEINEAFEELKTGSKRQQKYAQKDRTSNLNKLLIEILRKKPSLTQEGWISELQKYEGGDIIEEILEGENIIYFRDENGKGGKKAKISGLKDRVSRLKKKLNN